MIKEQGITELADAIAKHRAYLDESGLLAQRAQRQVYSEIQTLVVQAVTRPLLELDAQFIALQKEVSAEEWQTLLADVSNRERDPYSVASELQTRVGLKHES